jgi:hypothetical protein
MEQDENAVEAPETDAAPVVTPEQGLDELKKSLDRERRAREVAEQMAREASERANRAVAEADDTNLALVKSAIEGMKRDQAAYKASWGTAMASGDYSAAADAQEAMATAAAKLVQLENGKTAMETRPKEVPRPAPADPVEALAAQLSPRSAGWVRNHPEFARDPVQYQRMLAAHNLAVSDGIAADTDAYFEAIEASLRIRPVAPAVAVAVELAEPAQRRASSPSPAPVNRESKPNSVRLTPDQREMAAMMGMSEVDYATNLRALQKEGKIR